jgi:hypothetical protein
MVKRKAESIVNIIGSLIVLGICYYRLYYPTIAFQNFKLILLINEMMMEKSNG